MSTQRDPETDQPLPTASEHPIIQRLIIEEVMQESMDIGFRKYGVRGLQPHNGRDTLKDLEDELRDALVYVRSARYERDNPPVTEGLKELRGALLALVYDPEVCDEDEGLCDGCHDYVDQLLKGEELGGQLAKAVSTIRREAFERGASPAVGALLAEIQDYGPTTQYRQGLERAVELLIESWADSFKAAYEHGVKEGRKQTQAEQTA